MSAKGRRRTLGLALALLALPSLVALVEAASFSVRNRSNRSLVSSGEEREYLVHVPESYDPGQPTALVLSLHGGAAWPAVQRDLSGWNRLADRHGFIVAYPAGTGAERSRIWRVFHPGPEVDREVRFIADLIDELEERYAIDPRRIYVNGISNGGGMTFVLACTLSEGIAAVGTVAAAHMLPWRWCEEPPPVPVISFHGTADPVVPYEGGESWVSRSSFPDVEEWTAQWARRNRCAPAPVEIEVAPDVTSREYRGCADDADVVLYTIRGGGHTWPGGEPLPEWFLGATTDSIDATARMWEFFRAHSLAADLRAGDPRGR